MSRIETMRAAMWAFATTAGTRVITLASLVILARLLAPADFGLLAFALVYITYAETIGDLGTAVALIYWPDRREDAAQLTFLMNIAAGIFWFLLTIAIAPFVADFFENPQAAPIVRALAFAFLIKFAGNTHDALAQKDLRFRARAVPELGLTVIKALIAIALALRGFGAWSLVWGHLLGLLAWTVLQWSIVSWRPSLRLPRDLVLPMFRYGRGIVAVNVIAAVVHHADLLVVGRMLGARALGLYQIAYKVPEATITVVIWVVSKVLFPAFAKRLSSGGELDTAYLQALRYVSFVTIPMSAGLALVAEPLVAVLFGSRWLEAAPLLRWLAVYAGLRALGTHAGDVLKASGRSGLLAMMGLVKAAVLIPALIYAGRFGVREVAMAMAAVTSLTLALNLYVVAGLLKLSFLRIARALATGVMAGASVVIAGLALRTTLSPLNAYSQLALLIVTCSVVYGAAALLIDRKFAFEILNAFRRPVTDAGS
ncbi:MAG TPA: lipopolysaccharide biosynthesis protein [Thermoanaerobaculia bacterium]|nr:lipopolysaccharide biosynthesis protein [Thermoanaerobaculia bacterium]